MTASVYELLYDISIHCEYSLLYLGMKNYNVISTYIRWFLSGKTPSDDNKFDVDTLIAASMNTIYLACLIIATINYAL